MKIFTFCNPSINTIHPDFKENIDLLQSNNPNHEVQYIDYDWFEQWYKDIDYDSYINYYCKMNKNFGAMIGDYQKAVLLYYIGGVAIDIKNNVKCKIDDITALNPNSNIIMWAERQKMSEVYIGFFVCPFSGDPLFKDWIDGIHKNIDNYDPSKIKLKFSRTNVLRMTGPRLLTKIFNEKYKHYFQLRWQDYTYQRVKKYKEKYALPHYSVNHEHLINL